MKIWHRPDAPVADVTPAAMSESLQVAPGFRPSLTHSVPLPDVFGTAMRHPRMPTPPERRRLYLWFGNGSVAIKSQLDVPNNFSRITRTIFRVEWSERFGSVSVSAAKK